MLKNHIQIVVEKLFPDPFLKKQNWVYLWINSLKDCRQITFVTLKGNPNSQGILNWIIQILHYYCRMQHTYIKNSQIIGQNVVTSLCPSLCLLPFSCASFALLLSGTVFSVLGHSYSAKLNITSDHCEVYSFSLS